MLHRSSHLYLGVSVRKTDNLAALESLSEEGMLTALQKRYKENVIYTFVGDILIACNPFQQLPIYSDVFQNLFLPSHPNHNPFPHIFGVAQVLPPLSQLEWDWISHSYTL